MASTNPLVASSRASRSSTIPIITSSGTRSPASIMAFAVNPDAVLSCTALRRMSPVEIFGMPFSAANRSACVPFPAPGAPSMTRFSPTPAIPDGP